MSLRITVHAIDRYLLRVEQLKPRDIKAPTSRMRARTQIAADMQGVEPVRSYPTTAVLMPGYIAMIKQRAVITILGPNDSHYLPSYAVIDRRNFKFTNTPLEVAIAAAATAEATA